MAQHTPGPWRHEIHPKGYAVKNDGGLIACICRNEDDARLITAAPELLAALEALSEYVESFKWGQTWPSRPHLLADAARAAIAKATSQH